MSSLAKTWFLLTTLCITMTRTVLAISCAGCVDLDELNFDPTVARFPYAFVKFDIAFPYGEKHEAFAEFSKAAHKVTDELLVATVGIKDYGEMENKELGLRYKVDEKNFPGLFLFKGSVDNYVRFPSHLDVTLNNLKKFVSDNTALYIGRDGCLKEYNDLVQNYANLDHETQIELFAKATEMAQRLSRDTDKSSASTYTTFMRKINEKGYDFVEEETKRLLRLKAGKVTAAKKVELSHKLNIIESFRVPKVVKDAKQDL